jgi:hypothetical protein
VRGERTLAWTGGSVKASLQTPPVRIVTATVIRWEPAQRLTPGGNRVRGKRDEMKACLQIPLHRGIIKNRVLERSTVLADGTPTGL